MNKINYDRMCMAVIRQQTAAGRVPTLLLHSCCAPCSSATLEWLSQYFQITVFYYNPNIAPEGEFQKRLAEQRRLIAHQPAVHPVQLIAGDYEPAAFAAVAKGYEDCPEGGARCMRCYRQRLEKTAALAKEIRERYDWCLMDAPAGLGQGFKMAACMADQVIVVTTTDISAMRDAQRTAMELSSFPANAVHLVVGRVSRKTLRTLHTTIDDAIDTAGLPLLGVVPEDEDVPYCLNRGLVLRERNYYAARAYENIAKRIMGRKTPLMKI